VKRLIDLILVIPAVILLLLVFVVIVVATKLSGRGTVIFAQERAGKDGKPFTFYKFRTMKLDVEPFGPSPKSSNDKRLTRTGAFLREYSLDELPQLLNILKGDMSIVGPRPLYISQIAEWNQRQKKRLAVKPGLTGLAQISGRGGITCEEKLELDVKYVETASLWLDLKIILATVVQVFSKKDIYEKKYSKTEYTRSQTKEQ